ncbi:RagB/SusD family nutrient uptake outer membrane protein [Algoriphagus sp. AGSA1]|uniref:RagB/SusD family nutrient uptake outer membrane protein n=1 Tax=unclassified Algoriphagus TaxID=2641541 RepID=UPI00177AF08D|nr:MULTISPECIES: RagB/SusD family nutrient uptake outer membrane protein [unclassified Algoriphagus]MCE7057585.1 RagB/SusD family nutrient uptake outer membrane protein [Algoriphagus sp. AGSA1]
MKTHYIKVLLVLFGFIAQSCSEFLDAKPNQALVVPASLDDFQALLDAEQRGMNSFPIIGMISSDDLVFGEGLIQRLSFNLTATYFWEKELYMADDSDANWSSPYNKISYANVVLDGLNGYETQNQVEEQRKLELEASAMFYRAMGHFEVLLHFAEPFDPVMDDQLGIPIRLTSDVNIKVGRSTMVESFNQIISDLEYSSRVLNDKPTIATRPSKWAAFAMLGRVYLTMHNYEQAYEYSKKALQIDDTLMDYKSLDSDLPYSFEIFNPEVIFYQRQLSSTFTTNAENMVNPDLVSLYDSSDLRLTYFLIEGREEGVYNFRGNYTGDFYNFGGIATDEVILNYAESANRLGMDTDALEKLNYLLEHRMESGYNAVEGLYDVNLLKKIVEERRKELLYRGIRWWDLKRHNKYPELAVTLRREFNEGGALLEPDDPRYTFMIPPAEINLNPMPQNQR